MDTTPGDAHTSPRGAAPAYHANSSRIRDLMQREGWTVTQLAREIGMHRVTVQLTLTGRCNASPDFARRLTKVWPQFRIDQFLIAHDHDHEVA